MSRSFDDDVRTTGGKFGIPTINPKGSMDYQTAQDWVDSLNTVNNGIGYLGHNTWVLPTQPVLSPDHSCSYPGPNGGRFGYGCTGSDMGSLYNVSLGILAPNTAVPIPDAFTWPFHNIQPYLYWTSDAGDGAGHHTFSFNTGWSGGNVDNH